MLLPKKLEEILLKLEANHIERLELQASRLFAASHDPKVRRTRVTAIIRMSAAYAEAEATSIQGAALARAAVENFIFCDWAEARICASCMLFVEDFDSDPEFYGKLRTLWTPFVQIVNRACDEAERLESGKELDS